ncbi:MAG: PaaI family thioesterase [Desulfobacterales bacterium]
MENTRVRTITWQDAKLSARASDEISGYDYLCGIRDGKIEPPPAAKLIGYRITEVEEGNVIFELDPAEYHYNPFATVHGGIATTLLDTTMTASVLSTLSTGFTCSTLEIKVNFIRPITHQSGTVHCRAKIIHQGRLVARVEARIVDAMEKLYAHAMSTCMIHKTEPFRKQSGSD